MKNRGFYTTKFPYWLACFVWLLLNVPNAIAQTFVPGGVSQIEWPFNGTPTNNYQGWTLWNGSGHHTNDDYHSQDWGRTSNNAAVCGDAFYSPISGTIKYIERNYNMTTGTGNQYGNCVYIQSDVNPNFLFLVAHLATVPTNLTVGGYVSKRANLGTIGRTGCCAGNSCHAHMTLYNGPISLLSSNGYYGGNQSNAAQFNVNNWTATPATPPAPGISASDGSFTDRVNISVNLGSGSPAGTYRVTIRRGGTVIVNDASMPSYGFIYNDYGASPGVVYSYSAQVRYSNSSGVWSSWSLPGTNNGHRASCAIPPAQGGGWPSTAINLNGSDGYAQSSGLRRYDSRHNVRLGWHNGWCGNSNVSGDTWFKFRIPSTGTFTFQTEAGDVGCTTNMGQAIVRMFWTNNGSSNGSDLNYFYCASPIANNSGRQMPHIWFQAQGHGLAGKWVYVQVVGYANHQGVFRAALNKLSNTGLVADNSDNPEAMAAYAYDIDMPDALPPTLIPLTVQAKVEDAVTESTLRVFPNPARDFFNVEVNYSGMEKDGQATIMIKNLNGQILQRRTVGVSQGNNLFEMDSSNLPNGIYLASMALPDGTMLHYKVLVQK